MDFDERFDTPRAPKPGWNRQPRTPKPGGGGKFLLAGIILALVALPFTPFFKRQLQETFSPPPIIKERIVEKRVEVPAPPPPLPDKFVPNKLINLADLFNGLRLKNNIETVPGDFASRERNNPDSYTISFQVTLKAPKPASSVSDMMAINAHLPTALKDFGLIMQTAKVSGFFHYLYEVKEKDIQMDITRLDKILSRYNYYDLETVLELEHPNTKQKALLIQGEMDVVSDGSDGDRQATLEEAIIKSSFFQASTSYNWPKLTKTPNPLLARTEAKLTEAKEKAKAGGKAEKANAEYLTRSVAEMKSRSFLIAKEDPFVVIPLSMKSYQGLNAYGPGLGDYVVVIHENKLLPAIIGDYGPREKMGEASLRIAKEINPKATSNARPVDDLKVSYLIFPNSADKPNAQPNYAKWRQRCQELMDKLGGIGPSYELTTWEDRLVKPPTPAPTPPAVAVPPAAPTVQPAPVRPVVGQ
jgi:hypothetical protein